MSEHTALYRTYRPQTFKEVLGQAHVVSALEGAIAQDKIAHAYLFSGGRGTGKTSLARIFAKTIGTSDRDLYEIDAASNRGVDDIRALREEVQNVPFESPYKVYIVDEVHMLTKEAFNALLKTLEEPPRHALFILATTELDRLPDTIVSRCQSYRFNKPSTALLRDLVLRVAKKEGCTIDTASADLIALLADGSYRDALGILQKAIASSADSTLSAEEVAQVLGVAPTALVNDVLDGIALRDADKTLATIALVVSQGIDMHTFLLQLLRSVRAVLLIRSAPSLAAHIQEEFSEEDFTVLSGHARDSASTIHSRTLMRLLDAAAQTSAGPAIPSLPLEVAVIELTTPA